MTTKPKFEKSRAHRPLPATFGTFPEEAERALIKAAEKVV